MREVGGESAEEKRGVFVHVCMCVCIQKGMKERKCKGEGYGVGASHLHTLYVQDRRTPLMENEYPDLILLTLPLPWTHPVPCWPLS